MSTSANVAITEGHIGIIEPPRGLWSQLRAGFHRFLEQLPEKYEDVDLDILKRVPVPI